MKLSFLTRFLILLSFHHLAFIILCKASQIDNLYKLLKSQKSQNPPNTELWVGLEDEDSHFSPVYIGAQDGLMKADKINALPGQPEGVDFDQYAGYITVDPKAGRALFYYFVESPQNSATKPLVLWLNGGTAKKARDALLLDMEPWKNWDLSESRVMEKHRNDYAWNTVANVIFLESPAGIGFSYSNTSDYIKNGDKRTAEDSYTFLIGNAWIDDGIGQMGTYDYFWTHALNSDETNAGIHKYCNFATSNFSSTCQDYLTQGNIEAGALDISNIYAPVCNLSSPKSGPSSSVHDFDPCSNHYVDTYLNLVEVQTALHTKATKWEACSGEPPLGYSINTLNLPVNTTWRPWYSGNEVGGYVVGNKGLTFTTVRGAGHMVPSYQPERALTMISSFLKGKLPPSE
ncbi:serine carboxypeptidase ii-3 [Quercus suber]|uniref:Serine carboxypeptidase ii-3 n=1 Tax=Quercus suber TaxID=58331 RepID=A0AAW0JQE8_QUESU